MTSNYPRSFEEIRAWAQGSGVTTSEARARFAQYAILEAIAGSRQLREGLVFKGGNALQFFWQPNRSTTDLDFSVDHTIFRDDPDEALIKGLLERAVAAVGPSLGVKMKVSSVRANPPGEGKTFVTFRARIAYALPGDPPRLHRRLEQGEAIGQGIDLDISLNEPIGAASWEALVPGRQLRVATLEDIVAEKLRALLQQPLRNRQRRQDLLDIAVILYGHPELDRGQVAAFLIEKANARNVPVSRTAFRNPDVAERARTDYAELATTTRARFVPFDEALGQLRAFVDELPIPD